MVELRSRLTAAERSQLLRTGRVDEELARRIFPPIEWTKVVGITVGVSIFNEALFLQVVATLSFTLTIDWRPVQYIRSNGTNWSYEVAISDEKRPLAQCILDGPRATLYLRNWHDVEMVELFSGLIDAETMENRAKR